MKRANNLMLEGSDLIIPMAVFFGGLVNSATFILR
jgi:hypothetical protein